MEEGQIFRNPLIFVSLNFGDSVSPAVSLVSQRVVVNLRMMSDVCCGLLSMIAHIPFEARRE